MRLLVKDFEFALSLKFLSDFLVNIRTFQVLEIYILGQIRSLTLGGCLGVFLRVSSGVFGGLSLVAAKQFGLHLCYLGVELLYLL